MRYAPKLKKTPPKSDGQMLKASETLSLSQCLTVSGLVQPCVHVVIAADLPSPVRSKGKARAKEEEQIALEEGDGDPKL